MSFKLNREDKVIYVTLENGKVYKLDHLLEHRRHIRAVDEIRENHTRRREWYRRHVNSRDMPGSKEARADYSDGGASVRHTVAALDGKFAVDEPGIVIPTPWGVQLGNKWYYRCVIGKSNCMRIAHKLMLDHWRYIGNFVVSVAKYGTAGRGITMFDFKITEQGYYKRIRRYAEILGFQSGVDKC